jgi:two-component system, chemotaxis family, protein-glutamate methylesterase/glutaminase
MEPAPRISHELTRGPAPEPYRLVVLAAPAGGARALAGILRKLPADFGAPVALVQDRPSCVPDLLATVLSRIAELPVVTVGAGGEPLERGRLYIAPVDHHLLVDARGRLTVVRRGNPYDPGHSASTCRGLLESAATAFPGRVIVAILAACDPESAEVAQVVRDTGGVLLWQTPLLGPEAIADVLVELVDQGDHGELRQTWSSPCA